MSISAVGHSHHWLQSGWRGKGLNVTPLPFVHWSKGDSKGLHHHGRNIQGEHWRHLEQLEREMCTVFEDMIRVLLQAGRSEEAVGRIQAQLEHCCMFPERFASDVAKVKAFEAFWNSGAPRIGEEGAAGWAAWEQVCMTPGANKYWILHEGRFLCACAARLHYDSRERAAFSSIRKRT